HPWLLSSVHPAHPCSPLSVFLPSVAAFIRGCFHPFIPLIRVPPYPCSFHLWLLSSVAAFIRSSRSSVFPKQKAAPQGRTEVVRQLVFARPEIATYHRRGQELVPPFYTPARKRIVA
ncbi:MAG: hypothetical protein KJ063_23110, partial [Anaerolineae bacterium]|nr:hypothetical protein [Anaerolineae bacterium]